MATRKNKPKAKSVKPSAIVTTDPYARRKQLFIDNYIICMNATEAARRAGYDGDNASLATIGWRLLREVDVLEEIDRRLKRFTMQANEILVHLTDIARGDIGDVINQFGAIDVIEAMKRGRTHGIKRFKTKTVVGEESEIYEAEIEMYDRLDALKTLAKLHGLLVDRVRVDDWRSQAIEDIKAGNISYEALVNHFDQQLATELFRAAGVSIPTG